MLKNRVTFLGSMVIVVFFANPVFGSLINLSGGIVRDTTNNLDWQVPSFIYDYNDIMNGQGGYLNNGWQVATKQNIATLFSTYLDVTDPVPWVNALVLQNALGSNHYEDTPSIDRYITWGAYDDGNPNDLLGHAQFQIRFNYLRGRQYPRIVDISTSYFLADNHRDQDFPFVWLSRKSTPVPEPAAMLLFLTGLVGFAVLKKGRTNRQIPLLRI